MADFYGRLLHVNNSLLEPLYLPFNSVLLTHTFVYLGQGQGKVGKLLQLFVDKQTGEEMWNSKQKLTFFLHVPLHQPFLCVQCCNNTLVTEVGKKRWFKPPTVTSMNGNTPPRPWLRHTEGLRSREFLLFPPHSVQLAHSGHSEWLRLVFWVRGGQSSERFGWLYPGSDSWLPGEGWEDVCICFPSILTRSWDPWIIYQDSQSMVPFSGAYL